MVAFHDSSLLHLRLAGNDIDDWGARAIAQGLAIRRSQVVSVVYLRSYLFFLLITVAQRTSN